MAIHQADATHAGAEFALALRVMHRFIQTLSKEDLNDFKELFVEFIEASEIEDEERLQSAWRAMEEMIYGIPMKLMVMEVPEGNGTLERWAEHLGKTIRQCRAEAGLTQEQLAEKTGIAQSYISRLEQAQHTPNVLTLEKLAKAFAVPIAVFDPPGRSAANGSAACDLS